MLIHSVTPPLMLMEQTDLPELAVRPTRFGYLEGFQTSQGFRLSRVNSTDLSLYLKTEYVPGSVHRDDAGAPPQMG